jgi:aminopeptidase N
MPSAKLVLGGAGAAAVVGIRLARTLYTRWRSLPSADRERIAPLAEDAKRQALDLRGADDLEHAARELRAANETLAAALVESAESDPELDPDEVKRLRDDLRHELERLASGEVKASRAGAKPLAQTDTQTFTSG